MRALKRILDLSALRHNWAVLNAQSGRAQMMAVVKANAYGHDLAALLPAFDQATCFAVAAIEEALALRALGETRPVLLLEGVFSKEEIPVCVAENFSVMVHNDRQMQWLYAPQASGLRAWLKVDSGMHRLGFPVAQAQAVIAQAQALSHIHWQGVASHFACADDADLDHARAQLAQLRQLPIPVGWQQCYANSAGIFALPEARGDWVRPGLALYGLSPFAHRSAAELGVRPVMRLVTEILAVRYLKQGKTAGYAQGFSAPSDGWLATIAVGYGDGFARSIPSGKVPVAIAGKRYPLVGRIAMDMSLVWLGEEPYAAGETVELFGGDLPAEDVALAAGTIPYTLTTMLTARVATEVKSG